MRYIYNYSIISTTVDKEGAISNHLLHGHYPHCIDTTRDCIVVFNVPEHEMQKMMSLFGVTAWEYHDYDKSPQIYKLVFRVVKRVIERNVNNYWNFMRMRCQEKPSESELEDFVKKAFTNTDYQSWRRRFYLSLDILGFGNQPRRALLYNVTEPIVQKLREQMEPIYKRVRVLEDSYASCPRPMADFIIDIFYEPDRIYCGCFCYEPRIMANSHFVKTMRKIREDNPEAFTGLASIRQLKGEENVKCRLRELGIDRGAFLNLLPEWGWRNEISPNFI